MIPIRAIEPFGIGVIERHRESLLLLFRGPEEAREDTVVQWLAWLIEGALSNGMIPGIKGELDGVPFVGLQGVGIEVQSAALANGDLVLGS